MSRTWIAFLALVLAVPAFAQDEAEVVPVEEGAEAEAAPAEEEAAPAEEAASEEAPAEEEASAEPSEPWAIYVGADYVTNTLSVSAPQTAPAAEFDSKMIRVRAGKKLFEGIGLELHLGVDQADEDSGEVPLDSYYGLYLVPNASLFDGGLELAFPVGYGSSTFDGGDALGSVAYGIDAELPIRVFGDSLPNLRLTGGWMVYYQKNDARIYGANLGLRFDFDVAGFGNPFAGVDLWPFGDDEEAAPAE